MARCGAVRYIISVLEQGTCSEQINLRIPFCYIIRILVVVFEIGVLGLVNHSPFKIDLLQFWDRALKLGSHILGTETKLSLYQKFIFASEVKISNVWNRD